MFWAAGWWLARQPVESGPSRQDPILSWILLILAGHRIGGVSRLMNALHLYSADSGMISIADLGLAPAILLVLASVTGRRLPRRGLINALAWSVCIVPIAAMAWTGRLSSNAGWVVGAGAVALAALLLPLRSAKWLRPFAWFGGISYAFYVVHFPLLYIVRSLPLPSSTWEGFAERSLVWIALVLGLSWLLEKRFQPWAKSKLLHSEKPVA
jgi:peptidoglycan/LPS O-acetylase OafA/YrhL